MEWESFSAEETEQLGAVFAKQLKGGDVVALDGDLGAGKTAFARGILRGLGYRGRVTSPTFSIANEYETEQATVVHFDMYRILDPQALYELGFEEYWNADCILLIEWSQNILQAMPPSYHRVQIVYGAQGDSRKITAQEVNR